MTRYYVPAPDGSTVVVDAPDGATNDQVLSYAKKLHGEQSAKPPAPQPQAKPEGGAMDTLRQMAGIVAPFGMSPQDATNLGAGAIRGAGSIGSTLMAPFDYAEQGLSNMMGMKTGNLNEQRRAKIDQGLTSAVGSDPTSGMYGLGKIGTEIAGTLGIPAAGARSLQAAGFNGPLVTSIGSAGMNAGGMTGAKAIINRVLGGSIAGAGAAGLVNPKDAPMGGLIGGIAPPVFSLLGRAGEFVGRAVSDRFATRAAAGKVAEAASRQSNPAQVVADIQTHYPRGAENIPLSAAAITQNPDIAMLERASRSRNAGAWAPFDENQARAVFKNVQDATWEAEQLGKRLGERSENWNTLWTKAAESQKPRIWVQRMDKLMRDLDQAMQSAQSSNPSVRAALEEIRNDISRIGPAYTPSHLQVMRANLNGQANALSPSALKQADRSSPAIISLKKELDDILNVSTGGKWQNVLQQYRNDSALVDQARAAAQVRGKYVDEATGAVRGKVADRSGDIPVITSSSLDSVINATRAKDLSPRLGAEAHQRLSATLEALRRQEILQRLKNTGTGGGGSNTIMDGVAGARAAGAPNMLIQLLDATKRLGTGRTDDAIAGLLSNPDELARQLSIYMRPQQPSNLGLLGVTAPAVMSAQ